MSNALRILRHAVTSPYPAWTEIRLALYRPAVWPIDKDTQDKSRVRRLERDTPAIILIALLGLVVFLVQYQFRALDDNRLTSWQWVFAEIDFLKVFIILCAAIAAAYALSRAYLPKQRPVALLFLFSFVVTIPLWDEPEMIVDASRYFVLAKHLELYGIDSFLREWGQQLGAWTDLPLIPLLYGLIFKLFGESRLGIQACNSLFFSGTVVLTYLTGKMLWDRRVGLFGGLLLLGMPYLLTQVPLMLVDVPTMFFLSLAIFLTIKALRREKMTALAAASIAITLALLSKYSTWLMLSILPVIALAHHRDGRNVILRRTVSIILGSSVLLSLFILFKFDVVSAQFKLLLGYQLPGLGRWSESTTSSFLFQVHPFITLAALFSIYTAAKRRDMSYVIIAWLPLLVLVLGINRMRYLLVVLPMLALMAAYGITALGSDPVKRFFASTTVASSLVIAVFGYHPFLQSTSANNVKAAAEYLNTLDVERIEVIALPQRRSLINPAISVPLLDLFSNKSVVFRHDSAQRPTTEMIAQSPLRFSWQYRNPDYFVAGTEISTGRIPIVIISSEPRQALPKGVARRIDGYRLVREWTTADRVFRYQTLVRLYEPVEI